MGPAEELGRPHFFPPLAEPVEKCRWLFWEGTSDLTCKSEPDHPLFSQMTPLVTSYP